MNIHQTASERNNFRANMHTSINSHLDTTTNIDLSVQASALTEQITMLTELTSNYENIIARQQSEINSINGVIEGLQQRLTIISHDISRHETMVSTVSFYLTQIGVMPAKKAYKMRHPDFEYNKNERGY